MTDTALLTKMQQALAPFDVYVKEAQAQVSRDFDVKSASAGLGFQIRYGLRGEAETLEVSDADDPAAKVTVLRYLADTGVRFNEEDSISDAQQPVVRAEINAIWVVEYRIVKPDEVNAAGVAEFSKNVMFHVWPYWREFIHASCARLRLPQVVLPMFRAHRPKDKSGVLEPSVVTKNKAKRQGR